MEYKVLLKLRRIVLLFGALIKIYLQGWQQLCVHVFWQLWPICRQTLVRVKKHQPNSTFVHNAIEITLEQHGGQWTGELAFKMELHAFQPIGKTLLCRIMYVCLEADAQTMMSVQDVSRLIL